MSLTAGQLVGGHYEVTERLGGGGFGETYLSRDLHLPDRPLRVIKRLCPQIQEAKVLQLSRRLFETEAQVLYRLGTHPQIPQLFAHFEELAEFYLVQEYIDGKDLSHALLRGRIWDQFALAELLKSLLSILSFVHQNKVIHRDLKPENIIQRRDGLIFLIDFGVVKQITTPTLLPEGLEKTGYTVGVGTPGYMPSEQAHGEPKFASDIYAVGMIGIQALTGIPPSHLAKDDNLEIVWRQYAPKVYPEFAEILSRMVRFDFRQRYVTAIEACRAIQEFCDRYPVYLQQPNFSPSNTNHSLPTVLTGNNFNNFNGSPTTSIANTQAAIVGNVPTDPMVTDIAPAIPPDPSADPALEQIPTITQYIQPWHLGLGIVTLGAIAMTTVFMIFGVPSKPEPSPDRSSPSALPETILSTNSERIQIAPNITAALVGEFAISEAKDAVYSVAISPDNRIIAGASSEQSIELWDLPTKQKLQTLKGHTGRVYDIDFSPDGNRLVSAGDDRKVILWDRSTGKILNFLEGHQERVYTAIFSPDGKMIATSSADRTIRIWDANDGKLIRILNEKSWVYDVSFNQDGKSLVSANKDGSIRLWDLTTGKSLRTLLTNGEPVRSIVYSNDNKLIASGSEDQIIRLWDGVTGKPQGTLRGHTDEVHTLAFGTGDRLLVSGSADKTIRVWSMQDRRSQILASHERGVASVRFSNDQQLIISGGLDGKIKVWRLYQ